MTKYHDKCDDFSQAYKSSLMPCFSFIATPCQRTLLNCDLAMKSPSMILNCCPSDYPSPLLNLSHPHLFWPVQNINIYIYPREYTIIKQNLLRQKSMLSVKHKTRAWQNCTYVLHLKTKALCLFLLLNLSPWVQMYNKFYSGFQANFAAMLFVRRRF